MQDVRPDEADKKPLIQISVRGLVEFILRSGDIDNSKRAVSENAMQEGSRIHRMIQKRMRGDYRAEVSFKHLIDCGEFAISLEGRADGIFTRDNGDIKEHVIDEIKGVYRDLRRMSEPAAVHLAQAKCYGAIYLMQEELEDIFIQLTYCNIDTEEIKRFESRYTRAEILEWFDKLISEYEKWASFRFEAKRKRQETIKSLEFPFEYREGQKELAASVYRTIYHKKRLFLEAPTGVGKTISTLFPAIKALGEQKAETIFYMTAKTLTQTVAADTYKLLRQQGLYFKSVNITAKEKLCPLDEPSCNPKDCPYAKGHYDRINDAIYELLTTKDSFDRETLIEHAQKYSVCPFELCLDMSLFCDGIICDYNYAFDPTAYLRRFFSEGVKGSYIFLVDEAHNLVDRSREMYSAILFKERFLELKKIVKPFDEKLAKALDACNRVLLKYMRNTQDLEIQESIDDFLIVLQRAAACMDEFLEDDEGSNVRKELLEFYFDVRHFLAMAELAFDDYVIYTRICSDGGFMLKLFCVDPSKNLRACFDRAAATILFSATLLPVNYYMDLLSGDRNDYSVYAKSSFDPRRRGVFIGTDVTTRYKQRNASMYERIADYIYEVLSSKTGNYMVFFPSYRFLNDVYEIYSSKYIDEGALAVEVICQEPVMTEGMREEFLQRFKDKQSSIAGFCVMGGIFSEGIDLTEDALIGAVIVGTGLPQVGPETEILKSYFDKRKNAENTGGFDYAYRIPGMNKVLQSAGRVIRTVSDTGVIVLLDDRFCMQDYTAMFPREWDKITRVTLRSVNEALGGFWEVFKC